MVGMEIDEGGILLALFNVVDNTVVANKKIRVLTQGRADQALFKLQGRKAALF